MILHIEQTISNGSHLFRITEHNQLLFTANTPFFNPITPMVGGTFSKLTLEDPQGHTLFSSRAETMDNLRESLKPLSYLFAGSKKLACYTIFDHNSQPHGAFFVEYSDLMKYKMVIAYHNTYISCYKRSLGRREVVSFYKDDTQVGQLTKPNCVVNNLDEYYLHFADGYENLSGVLAFFVIYYDFLYHNNNGEYRKGGYDSNIRYTYDKNSAKYDKDFLRRQFGEAEEQRIDQWIRQTYADAPKNSNFDLKKFWLIFGIGWGVCILIALIVLLIVLL